jgi:hypothetical protein
VAIDVLADLQLAGVVHERGLIVMLTGIGVRNFRSISLRPYMRGFFPALALVRHRDVEQGRGVLIGFCTRSSHG